MYLQRYKDLLYRGSQPLFIHKKAPDKKVLGSGAKARCPTETRTLAKLARFFDCGAPCPSRRAFLQRILSEKRISGHRTGTEPGNSGYSPRVVPLYSAKLGFSFDIPLSMERLATESTDLSLRVRFLSRFVGAGEVRRQDNRRDDLVRSYLRRAQGNRAQGARVRQQEIPQLAYPLVGHRVRRGVRPLGKPRFRGLQVHCQEPRHRAGSGEPRRCQDRGLHIEDRVYQRRRKCRRTATPLDRRADAGRACRDGRGQRDPGHHLPDELDPDPCGPHQCEGVGPDGHRGQRPYGGG